jgi:hypothetical protein
MNNEIVKYMKENSNQLFQFATPQPAAEPVVLSRLLDEIKSAIQAHVVIPEQAATALAVWVVHTYVYKERDAVAYVAIESPEKRCGKTTLLSVLAGLASRSLVASNITVGALFRAIDEYGPTLLIDEADTYLTGNGVMRGILNCGNTWRTAFVIRLQSTATEDQSLATAQEAAPEEGPRREKLVRYDCYCPKVVAMIGKVPDTIADRSIVVRMQRKLVAEKCLPLTEFKPEGLVRKCVRFAADNSLPVSQAAQTRLPGLNDRAADTYEPLAVLAAIAGDKWYGQLRDAAAWLAGEEIHNLQGAGLLLDLLEIMIGEQGAKILSRVLVDRLSGGEGWVPSVHFEGKRVTEVEIARVLANYGVKPRNIRVGTSVGRGYIGTDFREALNRYVPNDAIQRRLQEMEEASALRKEARAQWEEEHRAQNREQAESAERINAGEGLDVIAEKKAAIAELRSGKRFRDQVQA